MTLEITQKQCIHYVESCKNKDCDDCNCWEQVDEPQF